MIARDKVTNIVFLGYLLRIDAMLPKATTIQNLSTPENFPRMQAIGHPGAPGIPKQYFHPEWIEEGKELPGVVVAASDGRSLYKGASPAHEVLEAAIVAAKERGAKFEYKKYLRSDGSITFLISPPPAVVIPDDTAETAVKVEEDENKSRAEMKEADKGGGKKAAKNSSKEVAGNDAEVLG